MFNKVIMIGNLVRDPELRFTPKGSGVCSFSVALNRKYKKKDTDTYEEEVCFVTCTAFGPQGETISEHFHKGKAILVEGRLHQSSWKDKEGNPRTALDVVVENWSFYGYKDDKNARVTNE